MSDLVVSADGHYIKTPEGDPFFWVSECIWYLVQKLNRADVEYLLDRLAGITDPELGCTNVIKTTIIFRDAGDVENPTNANGHQAFNGGTVPDFADPKVVAGGTPDAPNDYWDHLDFIVRETAARGMYITLNPQWSRAYVRGQNSTTPISIADARSYAEFLGDRYKDATNVIWLIGGDGNDLDFETYRAVYEAQAEGILKGVTECTSCPVHDEASALWDEVTMTYHGDFNSMASDCWDINEKWANIDGAYAGRFYFVTPAFNLANPRPIVETEGYGYWSSTTEQLQAMRFHHYTHILSGGRGAEYMNEYIWDFTGSWKDLLSLEIRKYITIWKDAIDSVAWHNLIPDQGIILSANTFSEADFKKTIVASRSSDEDLIMVFYGGLSSGSAQVDLGDITNPYAKGYWINPMDGDVMDAGTYETTENPTLVMPGSWEDALLKLVGTEGDIPYVRYRGINRPKPRFNNGGRRFQ